MLKEELMKLIVNAPFGEVADLLGWDAHDAFLMLSHLADAIVLEDEDEDNEDEGHNDSVTC